MDDQEVRTSVLAWDLFAFTNFRKRLTSAAPVSAMPGPVQNRQIQDAIRAAYCSLIIFKVILARGRALQTVWV